MADITDIELEQQGNKPKQYCDQKLQVCSQITVRSLVISSTLAATWIMLTAKQSVFILGIPFDARYSYSPAFKYFGFANAIASASTLISLSFLFIISTTRHSFTNYYHIFFLHDLLMMGLVLSGCAAATAIGYLGKYGNDHSGWSPICDNFGKFCNRVTTSIAFSYFAVVCLLLLTILSATIPKSTSTQGN